MNLGTLIGELMLRLGDAELPARPPERPRLEVPVGTELLPPPKTRRLRGTGIRGAMREVLAASPRPLVYRELAERAGLTVMQVACALKGMRDVQRSGRRGRYAYSLKEEENP